MFARGFSYRHRSTVGPAGLTNSCLSFVFHDLPVVAIDYRPFGPRSILQQKKKPIQKARMGFEGQLLKVAGLENEPETKTDLTRNLTRERLIKPHISGDAAIRQSGEDLAGESARENCAERIEFTEAIRVADPKIPCRQGIR